MKGAWLLIVRAAIRGGNFNNAGNAGVFSLNVNNSPSNSNYNISCRACKAQDFFARRSGVILNAAQLVLWNHDPHRKVKNKKGCVPLVSDETGTFVTGVL